MMKRFVFAGIVFMLAAFRMEAHACTAFLAAKGDTVLVGNNEDFFNPATRMWFVPAEQGTYGRVYFGFDDFFPQGGMNEKGLFFDGFATAPEPVLRSEGKPVYRGNLSDLAMARCATVDEVIVLFQKYDLRFLTRAMLMFGDAGGNSVIIEGDDFVRKTGPFQVCTNFYQSKTRPGEITCRRYLKAASMLGSASRLTPERCLSILDSVHVEYTQYSNVYDLGARVFRLSHFHDFRHVLTFNLADELKKGKKSYDIPSLFPPKAEFRNRYFGKITPLNNRAVLAFLVASGFIFLLAPFLFHAGRSRLREEAGRRYAAAKRLYLPAQILLTLSCVPAWIYLIALWKNSQVLTLGLPRSLDGFPTGIRLLVHLPAVEAMLVPCMIFLLTAVCLRRHWSGFLRCFYAVVAFLLVVHLALFAYWGLIRIYV
jgi:hypothetical protein